MPRRFGMEGSAFVRCIVEPFNMVKCQNRQAGVDILHVEAVEAALLLLVVHISLRGAEPSPPPSRSCLTPRV